ncbi:MAG TPA: nickel-dependent lactate racemase [Phycisphaerae bacterium]|nr:nickel-dependent lactate racemase [Phycisphaerae bacterium]
MRIQLAYGSSGAAVDVPDENLVAVVEPDWPRALEPGGAAVAQSLEHPVAGPSLAERLAERTGGRSRSVGTREWRRDWLNFHAVVLASDLTRPCPSREVLGPILAELGRAGVPAECVTILIATGLHAPLVGERTRELVGDEIVSRYRVVNHFSRRSATLARLGETAAGTPVVLAREWVGADVRIATGVIEPHLMAGFSGGRKAVCPGIAGEETVRAWHAPRFLEHERALPGCLEGNPEHEEALAVAAFAPPHFAVNVTVDREVRLTGVFAGADLETVHQVGVAFLRKHVARPVLEPCDILVTTSGGRPLDATLYGAEKGLLTGLGVLKPGGTFVWAAALDAGFGEPEFTDLVLRYPTLEAFAAERLADGAAVLKDQWALENLAKAVRHGEVLLWSDALPADLRPHVPVTLVASLAEGLERAFDKHGRDARVIVLPHGPYVLPYVDGAAQSERG